MNDSLFYALLTLQHYQFSMHYIEKKTVCFKSENGNFKCFQPPSFIKEWVENSRLKIPL